MGSDQYLTKPFTKDELLGAISNQVSFTQLSTCMVGYLEHKDLQAEVYQEWSEQYTPRKYHDRLLSFGSPPVKYARSLLLELPVPE